MLSLYRRHGKKCTAKRPMGDRGFWRCSCCIYAQGRVGREHVRENLRTASREAALRRVAEAESRGYWKTPTNKANRTIENAVNDFLTDAASHNGRSAAHSTVAKYRTVLKRLVAFCHSRQIAALDSVTGDVLREFREKWDTGPRATGNNISRLKAFCRFCLENEWLDKNPAMNLRRPKNVADTQKHPFSEEEMQRILAAAKRATAQPSLNFFLVTLVLLMRHTGLRIGDAVLLKADQIQGEELRLRTRKTGSFVTIPIEPSLLAMLRRITPAPDGYLFVFGQSTRMETVAELWRRKLAKVFKLAGVQGAHPHLLRHTCAVDLLARGVDVKSVSELLGHSSVTITERFYAAWTEKRQRALSAEVRRAWSSAERPAKGSL